MAYIKIVSFIIYAMENDKRKRVERRREKNSRNKCSRKSSKNIKKNKETFR